MQTVVVSVVLTLACSVGLAQAKQTNQSTYYGSYGYYGSPPNPAHACINDICGPPARSNLHITKYTARLSEFIMLSRDPKKKKIYPPSISKIVSDIQTEDRKQIDLAVKALERSTSLGDKRPDGASKALYNMLYASPYLAKLEFKSSTVNGHVNVSIDEPASIAALTELSEEDRNWILRIGKFIASSRSNGPLTENEVESQPPALLLKQLYPGRSLADAMKEELALAQAAVASLKSATPMEKALYFTHTSPERIALIAPHVANRTVDENETRELIRWNNNFKRNQAVFGADSPFLEREAPPVEEILKMAGGVEAVTKAFEQDRLAERKKDDEKIQSCEVQFFLNKGLLPSKAQIDVLNQDIVRSRQMVIAMIKAKFPPSMHQQLTKAVEETDFITPPTAADFEKSFSNSLRQKLEVAKASTAAWSTVDAGDLRQLVAILSLSKASKKVSTKNDSNPYCDSFRYSPMSDGNYTTYGSVILSFTTATGDETGRIGTIMHELGHAVSKAIAADPKNAERLYSVRKCLPDQHTEEMPSKTKKLFDERKAINPKADGPYVEEDFGDTVAEESGKELKGRNRWCRFLTLSLDQQQYQESSMQADDEETHSSSLFRLLNFEMMKKGNVPDSCKSYYKAVNFTEHFRSCFDLANPQGSHQSGSVDAVQ